MNHHPLLMRALLALLVVALVACDQSQPKAKDHPSSKPSPPTQSAPAQPSTSQSIPSEPAKPLTPLEELIKTAKASKDNEAYLAIRKVSTHRTDEACALLIKFLREESALITDKFPSLDDAKRGEDEFRRTGKVLPGMEEYASIGWHFTNASEAARHLVMLDMPGGRQAAYEFRDQITKKWAGIEMAKMHLNTLNTNLRQAEEAVKSGAVPWKMNK